MKWWRVLFPKMIPLREHERIVRTLREQIGRMRLQIEAANKEKELLIRSSLKQEQRSTEIKEKMKKIEEKMAQ